MEDQSSKAKKAQQAMEQAEASDKVVELGESLQFFMFVIRIYITNIGIAK